MAQLLQVYCPGCMFDSCPASVLTTNVLKNIAKKDKEKARKLMALEIMYVFCRQDEVSTIAELSGEMC